MTRLGSLASTLLLAVLCACLAFACSRSDPPETSPPSAAHAGPRFASQIPAAQSGQGPIPQFDTTTSLAAFPTSGFSAGFLATVGGDVWVYSPTATIATDAGAGVGGAVVAAQGGGAWLLVRSNSGTKLTVSQAGIYPQYTEGGTTNLPWTTAAILEVSGALISGATITVPNVPGMHWIVRNNCTQADGGTGLAVTVQASGGTGFAVAVGKSAAGFVDDSSGTTGNFVRISPDT